MNHPTSEGAAAKKILDNETPAAQEKSPIRGLHTPEPWDKPKISSGDSGGWKQHSQRIEIWAGEKLIACYPTDFHEYGTDKENAANAKRIVSCVNALAGVQNPAAIPQLVKLMREATSENVERHGEPLTGWDDWYTEARSALAALDVPQSAICRQTSNSDKATGVSRDKKDYFPFTPKNWPT